MKITVIGAGYVGLANAIVLAQQNEVTIIDIDESKVIQINNGQCPISDSSLQKEIDLLKKIVATSDFRAGCVGAQYIFICVPTNLEKNCSNLNTSIVESVFKQALQFIHSNSIIVIKSTVPIGFTQQLADKYKVANVIYSPEFLREGMAALDALHPCRVVLGVKDNRSVLWVEKMKKLFGYENDVKVVITGYSEAEAIKLFSNAYLAMRIAFFNEIDSFSMEHDLNVKDIIDGVCLDKRIGAFYNNPSFGYSGTRLPKDTIQLGAQFGLWTNSLIHTLYSSNIERIHYVANKIIEIVNSNKNIKVVGFYRIVAKLGSDNFGYSVFNDIIDAIKQKNIKCVIYEPLLKNDYKDIEVINDIALFKKSAQLIVTNRYYSELNDVIDKVFTRDLYNVN